jgi:hypothetical protein
MRDLRRWWRAALGGVAVMFILVMLATGSRQESRQLVKFEPKGVMQLPPERISGVQIVSAGRRYSLKRTASGGWIVGTERALGPKLSADASMAVQFMNTSGPTREMSAEEIRDVPMKEFGLDRPRASVTLYEGSSPIIAAHFGARNADGLLQYMSVEGRGGVFLMSRFVGGQWEQLANELPSD